MTQLFLIASEYREALARMEESDLPAECIADTLEGMQGELIDKLRAVIAYAQTMDAEASMYAARAKELAEHAKARANRAESLRNYALSAMLACNIPEAATADFVAKPVQNPPSVVIDDEALIPAQFMVTPPPPAARPDKKAIRSRLARP